MNKKPLLVGLLTVIALAVVLFFGFRYLKLTNQNKEKQSNLVIERKDLPLNKLPQGLPANLPMPGGAKINQNYEATSPSGQLQATRAFETTESLDATFKIYQDYLKNNNWKIEATVNQTQYKMLFGSKDVGKIQISISENSLTKIKNVDISYTEVTK